MEKTARNAAKHPVTWRRFFTDFSKEAMEDNVTNGAATLAYYMLLALFPAMIFLLSLLPYLPLPTLQQTIMEMLQDLLPDETAALFARTVQEVVTQKKGALLSFGILFTIWSASAGFRAVIQQVNLTYDVRDRRPFWRNWANAVLLMLAFGFLTVAGLSALFLGDLLRDFLAPFLDYNPLALGAFWLLRWGIVAFTLTSAFVITYYFAPDVEQKVRFVLPGSLFAAVCFWAVSMGLKIYVKNVPGLNATYGSLGAVIVLMIWLNLLGMVTVLGSELNALLEHYHPEGKSKGDHELPRAAGQRRKSRSLVKRLTPGLVHALQKARGATFAPARESRGSVEE